MQTHPIYSLTFLSAFLLAAACNNKSNVNGDAQHQFDINTQAGGVHGRCLAIKNKDIKNGENINLIVFDTEQELFHGKVLNKVSDLQTCPALFDDRKDINQSEGYSFYTIATDKKIELAIGLLDNGSKLEKSNKKITGDINRDGKPDFFTQCASSEGIHFGIWSEKPFAGEALWSGYYYLGYDIEPNCPQMK